MSDAVTDDKAVSASIDALAREEHALFEREATGTARTADRERLRQIALELDRCWDLLRQRRAKREFGQDPDEAKPRDSKTVEDYIG
jgi:hypothetical protein